MQYDFKTHGLMKYNHKEHKRKQKSYSIAYFSFYSLRSLRLNPIFMREKSKRFAQSRAAGKIAAASVFVYTSPHAYHADPNTTRHK
jgi:hypothetical protein